MVWGFVHGDGRFLGKRGLWLGGVLFWSLGLFGETRGVGVEDALKVIGVLVIIFGHNDVAVYQCILGHVLIFFNHL